MLETIEEQRQALAAPVEPRFVKRKKQVKGPYTSGDYVRWKLNDIFGPDAWRSTIQSGPEYIHISERTAYIQVVIRLTVQFANGAQVVHDDAGVWPLTASQDSDLESAAPERYETAIKAAVTDGLKACAEYLGICFRPLGDEDLDKYLRGSNGKSTRSTNGKTQKEPTIEQEFDIRPGGPKDYLKYYTVTVPAFEGVDKQQAADILESQGQDALKAFQVLKKEFQLKV